MEVDCRCVLIGDWCFRGVFDMGFCDVLDVILEL